MKFLLVQASQNRKTGPIPVSISSDDTCPSACPLKSGPCYARFGPLGIAWSRVNRGEGRSTDWKTFCKNIHDLPRHQLWRMNVAGDLPGRGNKIDHKALAQLVEANRGRRGFSYSHKPVGTSGQALVNARAIYASNKNGFTINLSANDLADADRLADLNIGPVVTILPKDGERCFTPAGRHVIVCPQETNGITCAKCQLCAVTNRKSIVGFRAHGVSKNKADAISKRHLEVLQ